MSIPNFTPLPSYFYNQDYKSQEMYQELFNRLLRDWFNINAGFLIPAFTAAQLAIIAPTYPPVRIWYNVDNNVLQFSSSSGIQTITSV
jgi:hypothetical protein